MDDKRKKHLLRISQSWKQTLHSGMLYDRIPYGKEEWSTGMEDCLCGTSIGMLHILGCTFSQCPSCGEHEVLDCICFIRLGEEV